MTTTSTETRIRAELDRCGCTACECPTCATLVEVREALRAATADLDEHKAALAETRGKLEAAEADLDAKHATLVRVADEKRAAETALRQAQAERDTERARTLRMGPVIRAARHLLRAGEPDDNDLRAVYRKLREALNTHDDAAFAEIAPTPTTDAEEADRG